MASYVNLTVVNGDRQRATEYRVDINDDIEGEYVIDGYENKKNDEHYVTISVINADNGAGVYLWKNRAGV